jgi:hypothetical protein
MEKLDGIINCARVNSHHFVVWQIDATSSMHYPIAIFPPSKLPLNVPKPSSMSKQHFPFFVTTTHQHSPVQRVPVVLGTQHFMLFLLHHHLPPLGLVFASQSHNGAIAEKLGSR